MAEKLTSKINCDKSCFKLIVRDPRSYDDYLSLPLGDGLLKPSDSLSSMVCSFLTQVDFTHLFIQKICDEKFAEYSLNKIGL